VPFIAAKCCEYAIENLEKAEAYYRMILDKFPESAQGEEGSMIRRNIKRVQAKIEKKARGETLLPDIPEAERTRTPHNVFWSFVRAVRKRDAKAALECVATDEREWVGERLNDMSDSLHAEYTFADFKPRPDAREHQGTVLMWVDVETPDDVENDSFVARFVKDGDKFLLTFKRPRPPKKEEAKKHRPATGAPVPEGRPAGK
jgi:hypothetical protein